MCILFKFDCNTLFLVVRRHPSAFTATAHCGSDHRLRLLHAACPHIMYTPLPNRARHNYLYVNEKYKYVFCLPNKAGCTSWKIILANNTSERPLPATFDGRTLHNQGLELFDIYRLNTFNITYQNLILKSFYKVMVVRHPLERLVSAYHDKVVVGKFPHLQKYVANLSKRKQDNSSSKFDTFLEYVLHSSDPHWAPVSSICDVCHVAYNKIIKLETQLEDLQSVLPHIGPYRRDQPVHANTNPGSQSSSTKNQLSSNSNALPLFMEISPQSLEKVLTHIYGADLTAFGYSWKNTSTSFQVSCFGHSNCC